MNQAVTPQSSPKSLGAMIDELRDLKDRKREIDQESKAIKADIDELEMQLMAALDAQGTTIAKNGRSRVSISEQVVPTITDRDAVNEYVKANDAFYLFQNSVVSSAWRELYQSGETVPGTEPFTKRSLSLTKA